MKLFKIWQDVNNKYDTYDSAVVAAEDEETARKINPGTGTPLIEDAVNYEWCSKEYVQVQYLGETDLPAGVIVASFNAG